MADAPAGTVTFLFTDIEDSTRLWEEAPVAMRDALARHDAMIRDAVTTHGGSIVKMTGDGVLAVFGAANDALQTAVAVQRALTDEPWGTTEPLAVRMGLHTGEAYERDGDYYGQAPNRAARLMGLAHGGQVLVSAVTAQLVRDALDERVALVDVGEHRMRGLAQPEHVFQVTHTELPKSFPSLRSLDALLRQELAGMTVPFPVRLGVPAALAGRDDELARLVACWVETQAGAKHLAVVAGEPGIGKTALVARLAARAHGEGGIVLYGRCDEELGVAYEPFVEAFRDLVPHVPEPVLGAHIEEYGPYLAQLVPSLRRSIRGATVENGADSDERRFQLFASIAAFFAMVGRATPVVLVLDDLQWADRPTLALLRHLVVRAEPMRLLVTATYRDSDVDVGHPLHDLLARPLSPAAVRITLGGLDGPGLVVMLEQSAGHEMNEVGVRLAATLGRETGGNPFFVGELLRHLAETGALYRDEERRWQLRGELDALGLPDRARDVIGHRVAHLGPDAQRVLAAAAVIGQEFELPVLARVVDEPDERVLEQLERSERAALVGNVAGDAFHFRHALVQHALYQDLSSARRSRLHLRVADVLETLGLAARHPEAAAYHLAASGRPEALVKATDYAAQAGDAALEAFAPDEAAHRYRDALRLLDESGGPATLRCRLLVGLGTALRQLGDGTHRETLLAAAELAEQLHDADRLVEAALANSRGWASNSGGVDEERVAVLHAALDAVGPKDSAARARLLAGLASELTYTADLEHRRELSDEAVAIARRLGDLRTLASVLSSRFDSVRAPHLLAERQAASAENLAVARTLDDPMALWLAVIGQTQLAVETGDADALDASLDVEMRLAEELRQPYPRWLTLAHRTLRAFLRGHIDEADRLRAEAYQLGEDIAQPDAFAIYAGNLSSIWAAQGRTGDLLPILEQAVAANSGIAGLRAALAAAYRAVRRRPDAQAILSDLHHHGFAALHIDGVWLSTVVILGGVAAALHDLGAAEELVALLEPFGTQFASDGAHTQGTVAHALGRLTAALGRDADADHWFAAAEQLEGAAQASLLQAQTRLYWAEALVHRDPPDPARARVLAAEVRRVAVELDCPPLAARAARLLDG